MDTVILVICMECALRVIVCLPIFVKANDRKIRLQYYGGLTALTIRS